MTNLPITTSTTQPAATTAKQGANATETGDAQNSQPFGDVLARQIKSPTVKDVKASDKAGTEILLQTATTPGINKKDANAVKKDAGDNPKTTPAATDATTTLPTDMLAALLPQVMNTATATPATASDKSAANTAGGAPDKLLSTSQKNIGVNASAKAGVNAADNATAEKGAKPGVPTTDQSFAAALTESGIHASGNAELGAAAREATAAATAPQSNAAAVASLQNTAASLAASAVQPVQVTINTQVSQAKWADEFSQKITWLASSNKDQTAELHLNPPQLGPLDVVIKVSGDQATALFTSPHAAVRDAIEQAMPRLRDMMADNGIMLGNATVSDQTPRDQGQSSAQRASVSPVNNIRDIPLAGNSTAHVSPISRHNGIVDTFA